jgi:hypothetical protein
MFAISWICQHSPQIFDLPQDAEVMTTRTALPVVVAVTFGAKLNRSRWFTVTTALTLSIAPLALLLGGCIGPPILERQVLGYDQVAKTLNEKLLLLNIARVHNDETVHFTSTTSIAATFDWTTTVGASGHVTEAPNANFLDLTLGASASENPTFSIVPIAGEEFTKRIVTPFDDRIFEFVVFQGVRLEQAMRLIAGGIEVQTEDGRFVRFIENDARTLEEYTEFRRIAMFLQALNETRRLFVRTLVFEDQLIADFKAVPRAEDVNNGFDKGLRWRQKPDGHYELTRLEAGRVVVLDFDPLTLSDRERFALNERIKKNPAGFVYLELRHFGAGGRFQGAIKLRSMMQILVFLARTINAGAGIEVAPDPRLGGAPSSPAILKINVTDTAPDDHVPSIPYRGRYYSVNDTPWDRTSFVLLNLLFQMAIGEIQGVGIPITISK